jgi:lipid-binding SYLF domain-containing protein
MKMPTKLLIATLLLGTISAPAQANDEAALLAEATRTIELMAANRESGVPLQLLRQSEGVILVPNMLNASFLFGAKLGRGVFLVRDSKGKWGNPVVVFVSGASFGLQAGAQATELLMVVRSKTTVTRLLEGKGKITLGVDAGVAAGPSGTKLGADTDIEMRAEILSYAKSRGLFAGASLGGTSIRVDRNSNGLYYDNFAVSTFQIIEGNDVVVPAEAARLKATLSAITNPPPPPDDLEADDAPADRKVSKSSGVRRLPADPDTMPSGRPSTRRRQPIDDEDSEPLPGEPRTAARRRPPSAPADPESDDAPRPSVRKPRPSPPGDDPVEDAPAPPPRKKSGPARTTPRDSPELPG